MGKTEKKRKENHAAEVTKMPKSKRQKYGINKTFNRKKTSWLKERFFLGGSLVINHRNAINLRLFSKYLVEPLLRSSRSKDVLCLILS